MQLRDEERGGSENRQRRENLFSFHFKETSLESVVNMLSDRGRNFRYVIHPDVGSRKVLGLYLEDVTWREALATVARLHNLIITEEHNLVVVNTYENYMAAQEQDVKRVRLSQDRAEMERSILAASLKSKQLQADDRRTFRSFKLKYAEPNEAKAYLDRIFSGPGEMPSSDASAEKGAAAPAQSSFRILFSTFSKASILTAYGTPADIEDVARRIEDIDVPQQQIFIESRIVEVMRSHSRSLGVQWGGLAARTTGSVFPATVGLAGSAQVGSTALVPNGLAATPGGALSNGYAMGTSNGMVDLPATDPSNSGALPAAVSIALSDVAGTSSLNLRFSALERDGKGKTLSNPKIVTINGVRAKIASGREIPYQQSAGGSSGATTVAFRNAVISLEVTPFVTPDNRISLKIAAHKDDADFTNPVQNVPSILTRSVETSVVVTDGGTAVLGGVFENLQTGTERGVPFLSKIPVIGWLFKGSEDLDNEKELLIFITPRIVRGNFT
ncbi:MAG: type IV pilus secretin PilQ [Nitrospinae bacterium]|nr:type IV pilus secretin PilQ [Nitrospinota bacterium]